MVNAFKAAELLEQVRSVRPLIHNITNVVVTNFTANGLLALGASPVMAYAKEEVADMAKIAGALVLNIGTLNETEVAAMITAGKSANEHGVPVVLDPVGAGATAYRTSTAQKLTRELSVAVIRGNAAEIANASGEAWSIKGVDSEDGGSANVLELAQKAARLTGSCIALTGKTDIISDGEQTVLIHNGHEMLTRVTGAGCLLTSVVGAFCAVHGKAVEAAAAAIACYGVAAELAAAEAAARGPGSFQIELLNKLYTITGDDVIRLARIEH
ncbi:hydroxyethylthiazole kinase [Paenibacillus turpanensis]|uniref:hydroxyethylthiazole kinase n=1 Tax=Paenibacillus turpanensis TaxID=2689078 RepID=UPI0014087D46|nr:hydroxyethylthiazole kinase [Paenibacillus turpanensis]